MRKKVRVPSYQKLMPVVAILVKELGGIVTNSRALYKVLFDLDLSPSVFKQARNNVAWAGTYLRKLGFFEEDTKQGVWVLKQEFIDTDDEKLTEEIKKRYKEFYNL